MQAKNLNVEGSRAGGDRSGSLWRKTRAELPLASKTILPLFQRCPFTLCDRTTLQQTVRPLYRTCSYIYIQRSSLLLLICWFLAVSSLMDVWCGTSSKLWSHILPQSGNSSIRWTLLQSIYSLGICFLSLSLSLGPLYSLWFVFPWGQTPSDPVSSPPHCEPCP